MPHLLVLLLLPETQEQPSLLSISSFRTNSKQQSGLQQGHKAPHRKQSSPCKANSSCFVQVDRQEPCWQHRLIRTQAQLQAGTGAVDAGGRECAPVILSSGAAGVAQGADLSRWGGQQPTKACLQGFASAAYDSYWQLSCFLTSFSLSCTFHTSLYVGCFVFSTMLNILAGPLK